MEDALLQVQGLVKEYPAPGAPLRALDGVSFDLAAGAALAIMGPSGSGKSTLLNILGTLDAPTAGVVLFEGRNIHALSPLDTALFRNRQVGFVFQDHHLMPQCTAVENVLLPCLAFGRATHELEGRAGDLLERVGLADRARHFPAQLSGGERQRVAVARAMTHRPGLLLCDEPTGNLDAESSERVAELLDSLRREHNVALIVVTHNERLAARAPARFTLVRGKLQ